MQVDYDARVEADFQMGRLLNDTYASVKEMLERNKDALDRIIDRLCTSEEPEFSGSTLNGEEIGEIVTAYAHKSDLTKRDLERTAFM